MHNQKQKQSECLLSGHSDFLYEAHCKYFLMIPTLTLSFKLAHDKLNLRVNKCAYISRPLKCSCNMIK